MTTIGRHITEYWLRSLREIAATRKRIRADKGPEPPELERLHKKALTSYANCAVGVSLRSFDLAVDYAESIAVTNPTREIAIVHLIMSPFRGEEREEWMVIPRKMIPEHPAYIKLDIIHTYNNRNGS